MQIFSPELLIFLLFLCLAILGWFLRTKIRNQMQRSRIKTPGLHGQKPQIEKKPPAREIFKRGAYPSFSIESTDYDSQSNSWKEHMQDCGAKMKSANVRLIVFSHGTFVGDDPLGLAHIISKLGDTGKILSREKIKTLVTSIQKKSKRSTNRLMHDQANFLPEYVSLYAQSIGGRIPCENFAWSSGNHHAARLRAAIRLINMLAEHTAISFTGVHKHTHTKSEPKLHTGGFLNEENLRVNEHIGIETHSSAETQKLEKSIFWRKNIETMGTARHPRILLVGHSHAGQIFCLASHLLRQTRTGRDLSKVISHWPSGKGDFASIEQGREALKFLSLDFVLYGTPYAYSWPSEDTPHILNVINHRNDEILTGKLSGFLHTRNGDYVQQWGTTGSDFQATSRADRLINAELDPILGAGNDRSLWYQNFHPRSRVPPEGQTILVDYGDGGRIIPNCFQTVFGHGVYTKFEAMLFNTELLCKSFNYR